MANSNNIQEKSNFSFPIEVGSLFGFTPTILVGMGTCGIGNGADLVFVQKNRWLCFTSQGNQC